MIRVQRHESTIRVEQRGASGLALAGIGFALLGALTTVSPNRSAAQVAATLALFALALGLWLASRRPRVLWTGSSAGVQRVVLAWDGVADVRLGVHFEGSGHQGRVFGGHDHAEVLTGATRLAEHLGVPLELGAAVTLGPLPPPEAAAWPRRLRASGSARRAELACWGVGVFLWLDMGASVFAGRHAPPSALSLALALLAPTGVWLLALLLRARSPNVAFGEDLILSWQVFGIGIRTECHPWLKLEPALLSHGPLDLGLVRLSPNCPRLVACALPTALALIEELRTRCPASRSEATHSARPEGVPHSAPTTLAEPKPSFP